MKWFLLAYRRSRAALERCDEYGDGGEAVTARFALERDHDPDLEVDLLGADSLEDVQASHPRYFSGALDLG